MLFISVLENGDSEVKKALVSIAIEQALNDFSDTIYEAVSNRLKFDYDAYIPDCYEHPEYLRRILSDLFGSAHIVIINSIQKNLEEHSNQKPIKEFLMQIKA